MGTLAFVAWFTFFLVFKIRGDFYFFETAEIAIPDASAFKGTPILNPYRQPAAAVGVLRNTQGRIVLIFDDGKAFLYPEQSSEVATHVRKRTQRLELMAMLTNAPSRTIGRLQIWADSALSFALIRELTAVFAGMGFDEFDFAMTLQPAASSRQTAMTEREGN